MVYKKRHYTSIEKSYSRLDDFIAIFTTFNSRTGKIELLALPAEDEIKTVSLSSFKRSGVIQKRC